MTHFLIVYERKTRRVVQMLKFEDARRDEALKERAALELKYRQDSDTEVVMLTAETEKALRATHNRYFRKVSGLLLDLLMAALHLRPFASDGGGD
jgi:hypothetical protein